MAILLSRKGGGAGGGGAPSGPAGGSLAGTYPNPTIAVGAVGASEIASNAVGASELADNAVDTNAIANNAVTAAKVAADVATQAELDAVAAGALVTQLFDSTLGADAASIDSGAFSTSFDALHVLAYLRTTEAAVTSTVNLTFNADGGANYDRQNMRLTNTTFAGSIALASTAFAFNCCGGNAHTGAFTPVEFWVPAYAQTAGHKVFTAGIHSIEDTAADCRVEFYGFRYRSTTAVSRVAFAPASGNFLAGSRLTVYGIG